MAAETHEVTFDDPNIGDLSILSSEQRTQLVGLSLADQIHLLAHAKQLKFEADEAARVNGKVPSIPDLTAISTPEPGAVTGTVRDTGTGAVEWKSLYSTSEPVAPEKIHWNKELIFKAAVFGFKSWVGRYDPRGKSARWFVETGLGVGGSFAAEYFIGLGTSKALKAAAFFGASEAILYINSRKMVNRELEAIKSLNGDELDKRLRYLLEERKATESQIQTTIRNLVSGASLGFALQGIAFGLLESAQNLSQISENIGKTTDNIGQAKDGFGNFNHSGTVEPAIIADPTRAVAQVDLQPTADTIPAPAVKPGFELTAKAFGNPDVLDAVTHKQVSSTVGLAQAHIAEFDYGIKAFNPKTGLIEFNPNDVEQLKHFQAEAQADPDYDNKIKAFVNKVISLNPDKMDAFIDEKTGVIGNTYSYAYEDNTPIEFNQYKDWTEYFHSGEYQQDVNGGAHVTIENEGFKPSTYPFKGEDPVFKDLSKEALGIQDTDLEPGQVSSIHGLAQAEYAKDYLGIKDFDPINNDEHIQKFWQATSIDSPDRDPLYELRVHKIAEKFMADNPYAVLHDTQGNPTDLFRRINPAHEAATLKVLDNYHDLAAGLVNEGPVRVDTGAASPWTYLTLDHDMKIRDLAEQIFYKADFGFADFDPTNSDHLDKIRQLIQEKYGDNPSLVELKLKAIIQYIRDNEPENYFNGDTVLAKSALEGSSRSNLIKILRDFEPVLEAVK